VADALRRKAVAGIRRLGGWGHAVPVVGSLPARNLPPANLTVPLKVSLAHAGARLFMSYEHQPGRSWEVVSAEANASLWMSRRHGDGR
jgi:hypothetical protein